MRAQHVRALAAQCDVSDEASVGEFFGRVRAELGPVDILVNNAGIVRDSLLVYMQRERWDEVLDTNLSGAFLCIRAVARDMLLRRWGRIINIVSASGDVGGIGQAGYSASKAGLLGLTRTLAREFARQGVLVNAVSPGLIETDMIAGLVRRAAHRSCCATWRSGASARPRKWRRSSRFSRRPPPATSPDRSLASTADYSRGQTNLYGRSRTRSRSR